MAVNMFDGVQSPPKHVMERPDVNADAMAIIRHLIETTERENQSAEALVSMTERLATAVTQIAQATSELATNVPVPVVTVEAPMHVAPNVNVDVPELDVPAPVVQVIDSKPRGATVTPKRDQDGYITSVEWIFHY